MEFIRHAKLFRWLSTLKFKIIAMAVATAVLAATAAMHMTLQSTQADLTRLLIDNERDGGERMAAMLASKLDTLELTLRIVGQNTRPDQWGRPESMAAMLLERPVLGALFGSTFVAAPDGTMLARVENGRASAELPFIGDRAYFKQVIATGKPVISQPLRGKVSGSPIVVIAVPARSSDGRVVGVVAGSLALQSTSLLANLIGMAPRDGSRMLVIDQVGTLLAHPNPTRLLGKATDEPGFNEPFREWNAAGRPSGRTVLGSENMVAMTTITGSPWMLVHITPAAMALAPLAHARLTAWRAALVVGGMAGVLAGLVAWYLTQPISRLRVRAQQMLLEGTPSDVGWPRETGEIGQLAKAFQLVVTQRHERQRETEALLVQLEAVLDHAEVGIALTRDGRFDLVSRQFCRIFRSERAELVGQPTRLIYSSDEAYETLSARAVPAFMAHGAFDGELELARRGGQRFWARMRGRAIVPGDRSKGTIWAIDDVTEMYEQRERLTWASSHDSLTGLTNRAAFEVLLERASAHGSAEPFCALFIDLDRFKQVNDSGGHAAGDEVLKEVARLIGAQVRKSDTVARLGGDEFAVLLDHCPVEQAKTIAEDIRAAVVGFELRRDGLVHRVGASIGLVPVSALMATAAEVLQAADAACYEAKRGGRNRVALHATL